jgi:hypothetical protein
MKHDRLPLHLTRFFVTNCSEAYSYRLRAGIERLEWQRQVRRRFGEEPVTVTTTASPRLFIFPEVSDLQPDSELLRISPGPEVESVSWGRVESAAQWVLLFLERQGEPLKMEEGVGVVEATLAADAAPSKWKEATRASLSAQFADFNSAVAGTSMQEANQGGILLAQRVSLIFASGQRAQRAPQPAPTEASEEPKTATVNLACFTFAGRAPDGAPLGIVRDEIAGQPVEPVIERLNEMDPARSLEDAALTE